MNFLRLRKKNASNRFKKMQLTLLAASIPLIFSGCTLSTKTVSTNANLKRRPVKNISLGKYSFNRNVVAINIGAADYLKQLSNNYLLSSPRKSIPILEYHSISINPNNPYCVSPADFAAEMRHLRTTGYTTINFQDLSKSWLNGSKLPVKPILITFDDGYKDNYTNAFPILKQYKLKATIFMVTGFAGGHNSLSWDQMLEMEKSGLIDIQSHTVHHFNLAKLTPDQARREIYESKKQLESHLPNSVIAFCYPYGGYNDSVLKLVKQAGYLFATVGGNRMASMSQGQWTLKRFLVNGLQSSQKFEAQF